MIPKTIHYCWFGRGAMPELALQCIESWHKYMPDWNYKLWNEDNFDVTSTPYTKEAYESGKYAFVSDYVRLNALYEEGGLYMDVDFEVLKPFDELMSNDAFAGYEGSKHMPVMMGVCASRAGGQWVKEMLDAYEGRHFYVNGEFDMTPNVTFLSAVMKRGGFIPDGKQKMYKDLTVYPVDFFCPKQTTGEYLKTHNTYCETRSLNSWAGTNLGWKQLVLNLFGPKTRIKTIKIKRAIFG